MGTVAVFDQRPGLGRIPAQEIELSSGRATARDLIRRRIETDIAAHNAAVDGARANAQDIDWLVRPGAIERALNGERAARYAASVGEKHIPATPADIDECVDLACEAFARNGFFMIFDGRQIVGLDEVVTVERDSALTFLRLVPLVGG